MKDLKKFKVNELKKEEMSTVNGGAFPWFGPGNLFRYFKSQFMTNEERMNTPVNPRILS